MMLSMENLMNGVQSHADGGVYSHHGHGEAKRDDGKSNTDLGGHSNLHRHHLRDGTGEKAEGGIHDEGNAHDGGGDLKSQHHGLGQNVDEVWLDLSKSGESVVAIGERLNQEMVGVDADKDDHREHGVKVA